MSQPGAWQGAGLGPGCWAQVLSCWAQLQIHIQQLCAGVSSLLSMCPLTVRLVRLLTMAFVHIWPS